MNVDKILQTMNQFGVAYLMFGGMNFMLRHEPILTFDVDLWIEDCDANRTHCEQALTALDAEWGESDATWELVAKKPAGWLTRQGVFSLHSPAGAIDIFRHVHGLADWQSSAQRAVDESTGGGTPYRGLSDSDMLQCQLSLDPSLQKATRIQKLRASLKKYAMNLTELITEEENKRWRNWNPKLRWQALQNAIAWAESQSTVRRNTKESCLANQRRLLAQFAAASKQ